MPVMPLIERLAVREFAVATGPDHYRLDEELLARDRPLTGEVLAIAQVHATLALAAATALVGGGRIEADAWREVAGTRLENLRGLADQS
jgi:hypothetical protein